MDKALNAFTVDVEDYFQVQSFAGHIDPAAWDSFPSRVQANTRRVLDLLDEKGAKGTFFILGWIANRHPDLVREICARGHEIGSHGMNHQLVYNQRPDDFRRETADSKKILEDLAQREIRGYRAATYSITRESLWALDIISEAGFVYDSSIFPIRHDRYGIPDAQRQPFELVTQAGNRIAEFPISVVKTPFGNLPVSGGGYLRILPMVLTMAGLRHLARARQSFVIYIHPWEIDPDQPRIAGINPSTRFRHYRNLARTEARLSRLLDNFPFTTMEQVLRDARLIG